MRNTLRKRKLSWPFVFATGLGVIGSIAFLLTDVQKAQLAKAFEPAKEQIIDLTVAVGLTSCAIKGNVSINSGKKIFHVPGQKFYSRTKINIMYGERWFCTEEDARVAGWTKARR